MKRRAALPTIAAALAILLFAAVLSLILGAQFLDLRSPREKQVEQFYAQAARGQSESLLLASVGEPDQIETCGPNLWWDGDVDNPPKNDGSCVKWVRYNFFLIAYGFGFSREGTLVSRYRYVSE